MIRPKYTPPRPGASTQIANRILQQWAQAGAGPFGLLGLQNLLQPAQPAPPPELKPVRKLGVLLVHGIGDQRRGTTLTSFGEPLFGCLDEWLRHHHGGASLERVILRDDPTEPHTPAYATVRLWCEPENKEPEKGPAVGEPAPAADNAHAAEVPRGHEPPAGAQARPEGNQAQPSPGGNPEENQAQPPPAAAPPSGEATWLLAESNWADVFEQPSFGSVAFWAVRVVPWMILTQFVDQLSEALRADRLGRALFSFAYLVVTFPLALLVQLSVLVLVPMSLIPLLRPVVAPLQRWLSRAIGDSYVLLTSRFQFQSMVSKVQQDIDWLASRCDGIAILAHSQGAAVAHEAVRQGKNPKVNKLITFGSAVSRLKALRYVMENAGGMLWASSLLTLSALVLAGLYLWNLLGSGRSPLYAVLGMWSLGILLALSAYLMPFTLKQINARRHEQQDFALPEATQWDDYYATADPVPNGEMLPRSKYTSESREVHNRANVFTDHSAYWQNRDEFGGAVLRSLMTLTGGRFEQQTAGLLNFYRAAQGRGRRTRYRVGARVTALLAALAALFQPPFFKAGITVPAPLQPVLGAAAALVNWLLSLADDALGLVASTLNLTDQDLTLPRIAVPVDIVMWPVACVGAVLLWAAASAGILRWWDGRATREHFRSTYTFPRLSPPRAWWGWFGMLAVPWLGFWVWWIIVSPKGLWSALAAKLDPLWNTTGNTSVYLPLLLYYVANTIVETFKAQHEVTAAIQKRSVFAEPGAYNTPPSPPPTLLEVISEGFSEMLERLGAREFRGDRAAWISAATALTAAGFILFDFDIRAVVQAALGLLALSCGVLGWVRSEGRYSRFAAAFGLLFGVAVMPAAAAWQLGVTSRMGTALLAAALGASACAFGGAEFLRRGWQAIEDAPR